MTAQNTLTAADAKILEERFQARLSAIGDSPHRDGPSAGPPFSGRPDDLAAAERPHSDVVHALGKTVRQRDKDHRKFVLGQPCLVSGRVPCA